MVSDGSTACNVIWYQMDRHRIMSYGIRWIDSVLAILIVHEPSMKSVPSEGTSQSLLFTEGIQEDVTKIHDGFSKLTASFFCSDFNKNV